MTKRPRLSSLLLLAGAACAGDPDVLGGDGDGGESVGSEAAEIAGGSVVPVGVLDAVARVNLVGGCSGTLRTSPWPATSAPAPATSSP